MAHRETSSGSRPPPIGCGEMSVYEASNRQAFAIGKPSVVNPDETPSTQT